MPVLEVSCPGCGAKLKAPDSMAGKRAKCKKCGAPVRLPGAPAGDSVGEAPALSALAMPAPPLPDDDMTEVMMAEPVPADEAANPRVAALPSADPFDFSKPAPAAKPAFGAAKAAPAAKPAPKPPAPAPAPAKAVAAPPRPALPAPAAQPLSLEDDFQPVAAPPVKAPAAKAKAAPAPAPALPAEPAPAADSPFGGFDAAEPPAKGKKRKAAEEDDESPPPPKKARKKTDEEDEPAPVKSKATSEPKESGGGGFNPFADFAGEPDARSGGGDDDDEEDEQFRKARTSGEDEPESPRYRREDSKGSMRKSMMLMGVIGGVAVLLAVAAVVVYVRGVRKDAEQAREWAREQAKKEEPPPPIVPPDPVAPPPPKVEPPKTPDPKAKEKEKDKTPDPKAKEKEKDKTPDPKKNPDPPVGTRPPITLPKLKAFTIAPLPAAPAGTDRPRARTDFEVPLAAIKRVFPPADAKTGDACALVQTSAGVGGKGERLALDSYGPGGSRIPTARIEYDGDGSAVPIADMAPSDKGGFFLAATAGKLTVWAVADKTKVADAVDPYADKPEHAKAGLAAAYFAADPTQVVTVSTAGAVLLYDLATRKPVSEFVPPFGAAGKVAQGLSAARSDKHESVAVAVAGVVYHLRAAAGLEVLRKHDLDGDVGRSLGLAVSGGRVLYAFETAPDKAGKKDKAVLRLPFGDKQKHVVHPIPATAGDPKGAVWANETTGGLILERGVLWFDDDEGKFVPLVVAQPAGAALYYGDDKLFWYVVPDPKAATKSVLVALSVEFNDRADFQGNYPANKPLRTVRLDANGLAK